MPKGGAKIGEHVLFGKYRLCRKLGAGRSGNVFLAWHTELEEYRAVKIVPKTMADYETFRKEALFLKTLRHPGIPLVYPFSVVVLGKFRRFLLVIFLSLFLHLDFSFIYSKFSMPFWGFFY